MYSLLCSKSKDKANPRPSNDELHFGSDICNFIANNWEYLFPDRNITASWYNTLA
eukprot:Pgem_evm1s9627